MQPTLEFVWIVLLLNVLTFQFLEALDETCSVIDSVGLDSFLGVKKGQDSVGLKWFWTDLYGHKTRQHSVTTQ